MMLESLKILFTKLENGKFKYNDYIIYAHNFSKFDGVFILKYLIKLTNSLDLSIFDTALTDKEEQKLKKDGKVAQTEMIFKIIKRDSDFINIELKANKRLFTINIRDSLLLLPSSLKKLCKAFNAENEQKSIFPYSFSNIAPLDYNGAVPEYKYFDNISIDEYNEYKNSFKEGWNLREETIKYCMQDCTTLYQILSNFSSLIFKDFGVSLKYVPSISSLALRTYKTKFLPMTDKDPRLSDKIEEAKNKALETQMVLTEAEESKIEKAVYPKFDIPILIGEPFDFINISFTGGHVDVYIPYGQNVHCYDINSLYPSIMKSTPMAINKPKFFEGEELDIWSKRPYGFFDVEITAPSNISHPIIQTRITTPQGYRTVAPLGKWRDVLSSIEIYNALDNFGYKFKINRGYLFDTEIVYDQYIDHFNNIKAISDKGSAMYLIAKLLMNGLYGKTGQNYRFKDHVLGSVDQYQSYIQNEKYKVSDVIKIDDDLLLFSIFDKKKYNIVDLVSDLDEGTIANLWPQLKNYSGCVAHASTISAGARVKMSLFIKELLAKGYKIFYMDTDSLFIDKLLPENMVSSTALGKFKLEYVFKEAVFLAPKVYGGILEDGKELIKIKGLSHKTIQNEVKFLMLKSLLQKDASKIFNQTKIRRDFENSTINLLNQTYELIPTENKKKLVYENNYLIITEPFIIDLNKTI